MDFAETSEQTMLRQAVRKVVSRFGHDYYMAKTVGTAWDLDQDLMRRHGLEYSLWWLTSTTTTG